MDHERALEFFAKEILRYVNKTEEANCKKNINDIYIPWICSMPWGFKGIAEVKGDDKVIYQASYDENDEKMYIREYVKYSEYVIEYEQ